MTILRLFVVLILLAAGCSPGAGPAKDSPSIKIGFIAPLTGDLAYIGENMKAAVDVATEEINSSGGIKGKRVEVIIEDGRCDPKEAANAANKLINADGVPAIIGGLCSSETLAMAPMAEKSRVVLFSAASTNPNITAAGDFVFRNVPSDSFQGAYAASHVRQKLGKRNVVVLKCLTDWCMGVADAFKAEFVRLGGAVVAEESFALTARDLRTQIAKLKAAKPEFVYFVGYTEGSVIGLRQMRELGFKAPVMGADAWSDPKIWESAGGAGDGATFTEPANADVPKSFVEAMNKKTGGKEINVYAPRAYDAMKMIAGVIGSSAPESEKIKAGLYAIDGYQGIADKYSFDSNGDVKGARYVIREVQGGKIKPLK